MWAQNARHPLALRISKEKVKLYNKKYREDHKEEIAKYRTEHKEESEIYRTVHQEEIKDYQRRYRNDHREDINKYNQEHRPRLKFLKRKLKEKNLAVAMLKNKEGQCRRNGTLFNLSEEDISPLPSLCPVFGMELCYSNKVIQENSPSLDRVNPDLGYVRGNVNV